MIPFRFIQITDPWLELKSDQYVFTSLEGENPSGSIKDRMVHGELSELLAQKILNPGDCISEVSSGSTAVSLLHYCQVFGMKCLLFVPDSTNSEVIDRLRKGGAELHLSPMSSIYSDYEIYLQNRPQIRRLNQLFDSTKKRHYLKLGEEVVRQLGSMTSIIGAVGTGHSLLGVGQGVGESSKIISAEPSPGISLPGVRNVTHVRYGPQDTCDASRFDDRVIVAAEEIYPDLTVMSDVGSIEIPKSFQLVMSALRSQLKKVGKCRIFAVGAALKRGVQSN